MTLQQASLNEVWWVVVATPTAHLSSTADLPLCVPVVYMSNKSNVLNGLGKP